MFHKSIPRIYFKWKNRNKKQTRTYNQWAQNIPEHARSALNVCSGENVEIAEKFSFTSCLCTKVSTFQTGCIHYTVSSLELLINMYSNNRKVEKSASEKWIVVFWKQFSVIFSGKIVDKVRSSSSSLEFLLPSLGWVVQKSPKSQLKKSLSFSPVFCLKVDK